MRYGEAYTHLTGDRILPQYDNFHAANPDSLIIGSEVAWSLSSRGLFDFPVSPYSSALVNDTNGAAAPRLTRSMPMKYTRPSPDRHRIGCSTHKTQSRLLREGLPRQAGIILASPAPMMTTTTHLAAPTQASLISLVSRKRDSTSTNHAGEATFPPRTLSRIGTGQSE